MKVGFVNIRGHVGMHLTGRSWTPMQLAFLRRNIIFFAGGD